MDDDSKEMVKAGAEAAMRPFANLIEKLFGGAVEQIGGALEDSLRVRRHLRRIELFKMLEAKFHKAGVDPKRIPDPIWLPSLQEASLQDDEALQDTWANLLANAADPRGVNPVSTTFVSILKELGPREVKLLDELYTTIRDLHSSEDGAALPPHDFSAGRPAVGLRESRTITDAQARRDERKRAGLSIRL